MILNCPSATACEPRSFKNIFENFAGYGWAMDIIKNSFPNEENSKLEETRKNHRRYTPSIYDKGDTKKQLLARSRYLLFKTKSNWTENQVARAEILFREFPDLKKACELSMMFRLFYELGKQKLMLRYY